MVRFDVNNIDMHWKNPFYSIFLWNYYNYFDIYFMSLTYLIIWIEHSGVILSPPPPLSTPTILYHLSSIFPLVSCILILYHVSFILHLVSCILYHVSSILHLVSCIPYSWFTVLRTKWIPGCPGKDIPEIWIQLFGFPVTFFTPVQGLIGRGCWNLEKNNDTKKGLILVFVFFWTRHILYFKPTLKPQLGTFEWWFSGLMLDPLFFLISSLNNACSLLIINFPIKKPIEVQDIPFLSFHLMS